MLKVRTTGAAWAALEETLQPIRDGHNAPRRSLLLANGARYQPAPEWCLIDFDVHPSGELSLVLVGDKNVALVRLDAAGRVLRQDVLDDPAHLTDPYYGDSASLGDPDAMHPYPTLDTARLAAQGDEVVLLLRNGHNAVVAYRLAQGEAGLRARWRTVVEPGAPIANVWLTGTHDPFGDLQHPWRVFMDVDAGGRVVVAAPVNYTGLRTAHGRHFAEPVPGGSGFGALVTVLDKDGTRLHTTLLDTARESQLTAVRWIGAETVVLAGRIRNNPAASSGWDGYVAQVRPFQRETGPIRSIDIDRGDVILDAAPLADGRLLVAGASGYEQNTAGASISESTQPVLAVLNADGTVQSRLAVPAGPRQTQVTSLAARGQHWLAAGLSNGPGTHSADANPAAILADGWVREFTVE
ncbi:hypothetical protein E4L96_16005 [Massilia arenosa]|uniref:DUF1513 domain-containing protein n=1 Tax=Zemynaea arenosa TaxID=2561931 RepID=A0A4Y9S620_9BURK|nr:hypothetical protein [Massilia arenosa]TFW16648.1 hypothetical protein E4L96_16005 [Massilia arenosa]